MEFEVKEINGSTVYVRKNKKVVKQREDFPGDVIKDHNRFTKIALLLDASIDSEGCTHNCSSCGHSCEGK